MLIRTARDYYKRVILYFLVSWLTFFVNAQFLSASALDSCKSFFSSPNITPSLTEFNNFHAQRYLQMLAAVNPGWHPIEGVGKSELWTFDGHDGAKYYDQDFVDLYRELKVTSLSEVLVRRKMQGKKNDVLDLLGSGFFVEDQSQADSITGLRWGPFYREPHDDYLRSLIEQLPPTPTEILGDVMNPKTWDKLHTSMKDRGIISMDLVAMRPMGGWQRKSFTETAEQNAIAISFIIEKVLQILSQDGQFYFSIIIPQLPGDLREHPILQELVKRIEEQSGYHLFLDVKISSRRTTYELSGVLYPK